MAVVDRTTLKTYFENGDKPDESAFIDLIDSSVNIGASDVINTQTVTNLKTSLIYRASDDALMINADSAQFYGNATTASTASTVTDSAITAAKTADGFLSAYKGNEPVYVFDPATQQSNIVHFTSDDTSRNQFATVIFDVYNCSFTSDTIIIYLLGAQSALLSSGRLVIPGTGSVGTLTLCGFAPRQDSFAYQVVTESGSGPALATVSIKPIVFYHNI